MINFHEDRNCKLCGFFGCEGECKPKSEAGSDKKSEELKDDGQAYIETEVGIIDRGKTLKLYNSRMRSSTQDPLKLFTQAEQITSDGDLFSLNDKRNKLRTKQFSIVTR